MTDGVAELRAEERFWVVEAIDVSKIIKLLRVFGFTDRSLAEEEARVSGGEQAYYEIRIIRHHLHKQR